MEDFSVYEWNPALKVIKNKILLYTTKDLVVQRYKAFYSLSLF